MELALSPEAAAVIGRLRAAGHEAWAVGGCVRDSLLGRAPGDWDVTTSALPEQTMAVFSGWRVIPTGLKHGTITVLAQGKPVEVTTYRVDGAYSDGRRPDRVAFTRSLREDLARRDFTVNALAYAPDGGLVDHFGGLADLKARRIRCVGDPARRFSEDGLRILRALRFASVLDFSIEPATADGLRRCRGLLGRIAAERVTNELMKLLAGPAAPAVLAEFPEVLAQILPGAQADAGALERLGPDPLLRLAALFRDEDAAADGLDCLRLPSADRAAVLELCAHRAAAPLPGRTAALRRLNELGEARYRRLLALWRADGRDTAKAEGSLEAALTGGCWTVGMLAVSGRDLAALGLSGPALGEALRALLDAVMEGRCPNERVALLDLAAKRADLR